MYDALNLHKPSIKYRVSYVTKIAERYLRKNIDHINLLSVLDHAKESNSPNLIKHCEQFFRTNTYKVLCILLTSHEEINDELLCHLFSVDNLNLATEFELYQALEVFILQKRMEKFINCLEQIDYNQIPYVFLKNAKLLNEKQKTRYLLTGFEKRHPRNLSSIRR